jgi:predicted TIM-barrel fold metal-dependent hydrolase
MTEPPLVPGPDPNPRKPKLVAPPGACDAHCHVFGPSDRFPYVPERNYTPPDAPLENYLNLLDTLGLERAVIVQPSIYGTDNRCTEDAIRRMGRRARGVAVLDLSTGEPELARMHAAGFRGARINLAHTGGSTPLSALEELVEKIVPLGWHLQVYLRGRLLPELLPQLERLAVDLVIDHLGHFEAGQGTEQAGFQALLRLLERGRCWVKLCPYRFDSTGPPYRKAAVFARALEQAAPERLVWGTDWPHPDIATTTPEAGETMPNDGDLLDALGVWFEDDATIRRILVTNPAMLYGF